jgi:dihydroxyacetone kinase
MNKKLVNDPSTAVDESLNGLVQVHSGLNLLEGHGRVVIRSDISHLLEQKKVTLLSGGGSGHEPSQGGFVGKGMLSAAVCGSIFASPPPSTILAALRAISSPAGTLMIVTNYTGDRLTFGIAAEKARAEGMRIEMVVVGDDTALPSTGRNTAGRRGLCGTILVHKITGALAEMGKSLEEITQMANKIVTRIGTMSVSLSPCCLPGNLPSFTLAEDEVELGLGIHGEAGTQTIKMASADDIVRQMLNHLTSTDPQYSHFIIQPGTLNINNY